jgi:hypothetical protein
LQARNVDGRMLAVARCVPSLVSTCAAAKKDSASVNKQNKNSLALLDDAK